MTGATIERGKIAEVVTGGYRVRNLDRPELISRAITGIDNTAITAVTNRCFVVICYWFSIII